MARLTSQLHKLQKQLRISPSWGDTQGTSLKPPGLGHHIQILWAKARRSTRGRSRIWSVLRDVPEPNKQTEGLLLLSPGLLGSCHGVVTLLTVSICLGLFTFRDKSMRGTRECKGKSSCSPRASHSTEKGRESLKNSTQPGDNRDFHCYFFNKFISRGISELVPPAGQTGSTRHWVSPCQLCILWQLLIWP